MITFFGGSDVFVFEGCLLSTVDDVVTLEQQVRAARDQQTTWTHTYTYIIRVIYRYIHHEHIYTHT